VAPSGPDFPSESLRETFADRTFEKVSKKFRKSFGKVSKKFRKSFGKTFGKTFEKGLLSETLDRRRGWCGSLLKLNLA
jgi:hypothetical protein